MECMGTVLVLVPLRSYEYKQFRGGNPKLVGVHMSGTWDVGTKPQG